MNLSKCLGCSIWLFDSVELYCQKCFRSNEDWVKGRSNISPRMADDQWQINCDYQEEINSAHLFSRFIKEYGERYV